MKLHISSRREKRLRDTIVIKIRVFRKVISANNFALPDAEDNTSGPLNRGDIPDLPLLWTLLAIPQKSRWPRFRGVIGLFCFISIYTFRSFKNPFATIINLSELYFRFRRFILFVKTKKMISMNYHSWKPRRWVKFDLMLTIKDIYINTNLNPLTKFTSSSSSRSSEFRNILQWNISKMITKTVPISTRMVLTYVMKPSIPLWIWWKSMVTETTTWSEFSNGESHCRTNTSIRRNK